MKFEQGLWRLLPDVQGIFPATVVDVRAEENALTIVGYDHEIEKRSHYLHGTVITARFTSPMPDVIRVQLTHHKGRLEAKPDFDLNNNVTNENVDIVKSENIAYLKTGNLCVDVPTEGGEWGDRFIRSGEWLTDSEWHATALMNKAGKTYLREQLSLGIGENVYGFGEHFTPFVKNGQSLDMWNEDGGTNSEYAYKNVPFYITSSGYGVLVNHPGNVSFEVGSHHVSRVQFSAEGHSVDYYLFGGATMKQVLQQYTALSGRPPLLPEWSFGLWLTTSFTTNYDEKYIIENIDRMAALDIPLSVFHFDCFWMRELTWTSFLWDERFFPNPQELIARIKEKGLKICMWINPYIAEQSSMFDEGMENGYLLLHEDGGVYQVDHWQPGLAFVDFTNPDATAWYCGKLKALLDVGVDTFKTDFGEKIPTEVRYFNGADPERMHNYYAYLYNKAVFELLEQEKGQGEAVVFARSATTGGQKFPVHWGGDNSSTYPSMAETLRGGLSLGLSGFGYWSHDISGFNDTALPDLYKRWVAFGLLSSHSRLHGADSVRVPWHFDEEAGAVLRFFTHLKHQLMPYLLDVAQEAHTHGYPMMRAMVLEFPDDPTCRFLDMQYMLGDSLLVAPIFNERGTVQYYIPPGNWRNLLSNETIAGGIWRTETHDYFSLPLWVCTDRNDRLTVTLPSE